MSHILFLNIVRNYVASLSNLKAICCNPYGLPLRLCITLIVPWDNCGHYESNALIVQDKMERGGQCQRENRQEQPSHLTEPPNVTAMKRKGFCRSCVVLS